MKMILRYQSDYSNQVHQLVVSVSRHFYVTKSGHLKFQKKQMEISLASLDQSEKEHVVHYLIRDHFSGAFYGEMHSSKALTLIEDFLSRAWTPKTEYPFCGTPEYLTIPKTVEAAFPTVNKFIESLQIEPIPVTSGFFAGVRDVRTWEEHIRWNAYGDEDWRLFKSAQARTLELSVDLNSGFGNGDSKILKWVSGLDPYLPNDR